MSEDVEDQPADTDRIGVPDEVRAAARRVSNWGRWGSEDELGTLNHITPAAIAHASTLIRQGKMFSLSVPLDSYGPQGAGGYRRNPIHLMSVDGGDDEMTRRLGDWGGPTENRIGLVWRSPFRFTDDFIIMPLQAATQWDALSHGYYEGQLYNGFPADSITSFGAARDGIDKVAATGAVVGRGVLLDVARHRGVERLAPLSIIEPEELEATAEAQGVQVGEGDIVVIRMGWWQQWLETRDTTTWGPTSPGISWRCADWLHERKVAAIAADNFAVETPVQEFPGVFLPFHMLALRDMGMMLGEIWDLEALGRDCAEDGVYEFMLVAQPLLITGAVGSPVNPVALK